MWDDYGNGWGIHGWMWGSWMAVVLVIVLLVALAGAVVVALLQGGTRSPESGRDIEDPEALQILRRRFAAGEIDENEFRSREKTLAQSLRDLRL